MTPRRRTYLRRPRLWRRPSNGVYYIVWPEEGNLRRVSTKTEKRADAEAALRVFLEDFTNPRRPRRDVTLHEGIREWLADRQRPRHALQPKTLEQYARYATLFQRHFPERLRPADVTPALIRGYLDAREEKKGGKPVGPSTLRKELVALSMAFRFLLREGLVHGNPCNAVQVRARPKRHPAMTEEEFTALRAAMTQELKSATSPQVRADAQELSDLADVLWHSGLRYIEAIRLRWEDIDFEKGLWTIRSPENKGGEQTLPFHPSILPILRRRKLLSGPGPFRDYWPLEKLWAAFKKRNPEFKGRSWHELRHSFISRLRMKGLDAAAMVLARHHSQAIQDLYTHVGITTLRRSLDAI